MGVFNSVRYEAPCPGCGTVQTQWQSKEGNCCFDTVEPWEVSRFYCVCNKCGKFINAAVDAEVEKVVTVKRCDIKLTASSTARTMGISNSHRREFLQGENNER